MRDVISPLGESIAGVRYTISVRVGILSAAARAVCADPPPTVGLG
jgi:hypothetical protein